MRRSPVYARNVVATSQPLATAAGLDALRKGGSAADAALAAAITLTVVEPCSNGIGSDAQAIIWDGTALHGLNASGRAPQALTPARFAGRKEMPPFGWDAVTVPGAPSAWVAVHERFGKLPFAALFEDAVRHADRGWLVSPVVAAAWGRAREEQRRQPGFAEAFWRGGRAPVAGELFKFPEQARTLREIAETRAKSFYEGALARKIAGAGGPITEADLAAHRPEWVEPMAQAFGDVTLRELPPNTQGLAALIALGIARALGVHEREPESADWYHLQIEAMKAAFSDAHRYFCDPAHKTIAFEALLDPAYLAARAKLVRLDRATEPAHGVPPKGGTVYLTAADERGMMVSFIQSNYMGFGSGVVIPGTGISLQNRGNGFSLVPGHPNEVGPGKKPFHTIIPGFVMRGAAPDMSFGVMGGHMQPQGHLQMMLRVYGRGQDPQAASDAPRWRCDGGMKLALEHGFPEAVARELAARGHEVQLLDGTAFGGAQLIKKLADGYVAGSDHRKDGHAAGF